MRLRYNPAAGEAAAVAYLASDDSSLMTGSDLEVDGCCALTR